MRPLRTILAPLSQILPTRPPVPSSFLLQPSATSRALGAAVLLVLLPALASAQGGSEVFATARMHFGPLALTPRLALTNAGVDDNVFNEPNQSAPKRDFTFTVTPQTDWWLRLGPSWLSGTIKEDLVYFNKYAGERSVNQFYRGRVDVPLSHISLNGGIEYLNTRDRPGFEIDARSQRYELGVTAGIDVRIFSKTSIDVAGRRQSIDYGKSDVFLGNSLDFDLNRTVETASLTVKQRLTPLTSVVVKTERERDRFTFNSLRDSDSVQVSAGLTFEPFAPISGQCFFGYRNFNALGQGVPRYSGMIASVDLSYSALDTMKLAVQAGRQLEYSFDMNSPYYVQTGVATSVTREVYGPLDVVGRLGVQRLDYRSRLTKEPLPNRRSDYVHFQGGGVGYHFSAGLRVGFNVERQTRTSALTDRSYSGFRYGTTITYGF